MKRLVACVLLLVLVISLPTVMQAQEDRSPIAEAEFWLRLEQTNLELLSTLGQGQAALALSREQLLPLWRNVDSIRVGDQIIAVDTRWIISALETSDLDAWSTLQKRMSALLDYHQQSVLSVPRDTSLSALESILQDPRFEYEEASLTPEPTIQPQEDEQPTASVITPELSQLLLIVLGVLVVVVALVYFGRRLNVTPAQLPTSTDKSDEPTSSIQATDVAANFAAARDYRSAIRYQYLSSLLLLNERGFIRYDSTLTNREHLAQVREQTQLYDPLRRVVNVFEDVWYGYSAVDEAFYQQYCQNIDQLQRLMP
ncbi:MAG: DUF4129 domain-containing protein [Anaerolineae bacterium]|nr:DUF4129 domain-containing protein [Anaerolineae bacterium]